jgi:preprotein translocase subunit SecF
MIERMDDVSKTLFWLVNLVVLSLIGIVGAFTRGYVNKNEKEKENMEEVIRKNKEFLDTEIKSSIKDFNSGVNEIRSFVSEVKELVVVIKTETAERHHQIMNRLTEHEEWLETHDLDIKCHDKKLHGIDIAIKHHHK